MSDTPMTLIQAARLLLAYGSFTHGRGATGYGEVYECACCSHAMNAGDRKHADDCKLEQARLVVKSAV